MQMHSTRYYAARVANLSKIDISAVLNTQGNEQGKISYWQGACEQKSALEEGKPLDRAEYQSKIVLYLNGSSIKSRAARIMLR